MDVRVRFEKGVFIPLEPVSGIEEGQEFILPLAEDQDGAEMSGGAVFVTLPKPEMTPELAALIEEAKRTAGIYANNADFDAGIQSVQEAWDEWNKRLSR